MILHFELKYSVLYFPEKTFKVVFNMIEWVAVFQEIVYGLTSAC